MKCSRKIGKWALCIFFSSARMRLRANSCLSARSSILVIFQSTYSLAYSCTNGMPEKKSHEMHFSLQNQQMCSHYLIWLLQQCIWILLVMLSEPERCSQMEYSPSQLNEFEDDWTSSLLNVLICCGLSILRYTLWVLFHCKRNGPVHAVSAN